MDKPVAWLEPEWGEKICPEVGYEVTMTDDHPRDLCWIPLYAHPPQRPWVGLTEEEIQAVAKQARSKDRAVTLTNKLLKEKNNENNTQSNSQALPLHQGLDKAA